MELLYLWISFKKGFFLNQGFRLSSRFLIDLDHKSKKITIEENKNFIENFFHENISNITAIIGENGAGKSSLMKYFAYKMFSPIANNPENANEILIFLTNNNEITVCCTSSLGLKSYFFEYDKDRYKIHVEEFENELIWHDIGDLYNVNNDKRNFSTTSVIYFSNVFDLDDRTKEEYNGLINICTNFFLLKDREKLTNHSKTKILESTAFKFLEFDRQIEYIISKNNINDFKLFNLPEKISLEPFDYNKNILLEALADLNKARRDVTREEKRKRIFLNKLINRETQLNERHNSSYNLKNKLLFKFRMSFLFNHLRYIFNDDFFKFFSESKLIELGKLYLLSFKDDTYDIHSLYSSIVEFEEEPLKLNFSPSINSDKIQFYIEFEKILFDDFFVVDDYWPLIDFILLDVKHPKIKKLRNHYKNSLTINHYAKWGWHNLSSGEHAYLTIFSRFHSITTAESNVLESKNNLLVFIDEADLYFHPQWQKQMIKFLSSEIPNIFKGKKLQFFISSHSPFLLSDLPPDNVLMLRKGCEEDRDFENNSLHNKCIVVKNNILSFGANIHTLFAETFFMQNGLMGEFAKEKIEKIINDLKAYPGTDLSEERKIEIRKIIDIIGEPILKEHLDNLYSNKLHPEYAEFSREELIEKIKLFEETPKDNQNETN